LDLVFSLWTREEQEMVVWNLRLFEAPWGWLFLMFLTTSYVIPVPLWLFRRVRRSFTWMLWTSLLVNVGMWTERFLIIVPGLVRKGPLVFDYGTYRPSPIEIMIVVGTLALVPFLLLLFSKFFPLIPLWEVKEGQKLIDHVQVGNVEVPALVKEH
ncbi:MAG: polysulfide reductase NrfD, partial [Chloroflexi bacterium]|nr:polysulfide reductase NrfD [Chloroflexota bacterium]